MFKKILNGVTSAIDKGYHVVSEKGEGIDMPPLFDTLRWKWIGPRLAIAFYCNNVCVGRCSGKVDNAGKITGFEFTRFFPALPANIFENIADDARYRTQAWFETIALVRDFARDGAGVYSVSGNVTYFDRSKLSAKSDVAKPIEPQPRSVRDIFRVKFRRARATV